MPIRISSSLLPLGAVVAAVVAYFVTDHTSSAAPATPAAQAVAVAAAPESQTNAAAGAQGVLPPNHPQVPGLQSPRGGGPGADGQEPPSITWSAPAAWSSQPNPNPMRVATYKVGDGAELSVARAGGTVDANVQRWTGQFDGAPRVARSAKRVHGLAATVVRIDGTFFGGGMGAPSEKHDGWSMLAAIVESSGSPYFFKLLGPTAQIDRARAAFDTLVESVAPRTAE